MGFTARTDDYLVPDRLLWQTLQERIANNFACMPEKMASTKIAFFDSFDWRLYNKQLLLMRRHNTYELCLLHDESPIVAQPWPSGTCPIFWWDFHDTELAQRLEKILDVRALVLCLKLSRQSQLLRILNRDEKTVLKVCLQRNVQESTADDAHSIQLLKLTAIRGYDDFLEKFKIFLKTLQLAPCTKHILENISQGRARKPGDYSSKMYLHLKPEQTAKSAVVVIYNHLHDMMKQNEVGIKADIDTEFLHDFRVAVRRTRSALTQIQLVLPRQLTQEFKVRFAALGKATSRLRDLDVFLLREKEYQAILPEALRPGLAPMFRGLIRERRREHKRLKVALESPEYETMLKEWLQAIRTLDTSSVNLECRNSDEPIANVSRQFIHKKYKQVLRVGKNLSSNSPDSDLHDLRIECKKLRYLLEFFRSLYDESEMAPLTRQLKQLQDNLGDFNDLGIQQANLKQMLDGVAPQSPNQTICAATIGGLIAVLHHRQRQLRMEFESTFAKFADRRNLALYEKLFRSPLRKRTS